MWRVIFGFLLTACESSWEIKDHDGDGQTLLDGDCWNSLQDPVPPENALDHGVTAAQIYLGAEDLPYDGIDANCDGLDDFDQDGDGFVPAEFAGVITLGVNGSGALPAGDCWDQQTAEGATIEVDAQAEDFALRAEDIHPEAPDFSYDGIDANCDYLDDFDQDQDGFVPTEYEGLQTHTLSETLPAGDCIDGAGFDSVNPAELSPGSVYPGAEDVFYDGTDADCLGNDDCDQDEDLFRAEIGYCASIFDAEEQGDCDDEDSQAFPNDAAEIYYNGRDDNCDTTTGDGDSDGDGFWAWDYLDRVDSLESSVSNTLPAEFTDCWDRTWENEEAPAELSAINGFPQLFPGDVYPGATDAPYDGINQDCGLDNSLEFDADGDGFNSLTYPDRAGAVGSDCIDSITDADYIDVGIAPAAINPDATETWYDGLDQNCNGSQESDCDSDGDGYDGSDTGSSTTACPLVSDCNDFDSAINPGVPEQPLDGIDQDCDLAELCYEDADLDGFGSSNAFVMSTFGDLNCNPALSPGASNVATDCNDSDATVSPSATEICDGQVNVCGGTLPTNESDLDGDGYVGCTIDPLLTVWDGASITGDGDCDDSSVTIHPTAVELCDGLDNDCDQQLPNAESDVDGDGYVECALVVSLSNWGNGSISGGEDCVDSDVSIHPQALELCDGLDNDCNTQLPADESDVDGDGYVECTIDNALSAWDGASINGDDDCNDSDSNSYPGATERCDGIDNSCDNSLAASELDTDGDGYVACDLDVGVDQWANGNVAISGGSDCEPTIGSIFPGAPEICDGQINECSGQLPETEIDNDGDGFVECSLNVSLANWANGIQSISGGDDCDDTQTSVSPGASEICDGQINVCGTVLNADEVDQDGDLYVSCSLDVSLSNWAGDPSVLGGDDCEPFDATLYPGANEICDGLINSCGFVLPANETDDDGDGYVECSYSAGQWAGSNQVQGGDDCNDVPGPGAAFYPGAPDIVGDEIDHDCDGQEQCYLDNDEDGYGTNSAEITSNDLDCSDFGESTALLATDCNDSAADINPGVNEIPANAQDDNCDSLESCFIDGDSDGFGGTNTGDSADLSCNGVTTLGQAESANDDDCNDGDASVNPNAAEIAGDGSDQDCDNQEACFVDADGDGFGSTSGAVVLSSSFTCSLNNQSTLSTDCDDTDAQVKPNVSEIVGDGVDQNCDGLEVCYLDSDGDAQGDGTSSGPINLTLLPAGFDCTGLGIANNADDCNDANEFAFSGAGYNEQPPLDLACVQDVDEDGYGSLIAPMGGCEAGTDCDDTDDAVFLGGTEIPNDGIDQDCLDGDLVADTIYDLVDGDLVITEIFAKSSNSNFEWFEIFNNTASNIDLNGLTISDASGSQQFDIAETTILVPGEYGVIVGSSNPLSNGGISSSLAEFSGGFALTPSDSIFLNADTVTLDSVTFSNATHSTNNFNIAVGLDPDELDSDNNDGSFWCLQSSIYAAGKRGTPNQENDSCQ